MNLVLMRWIACVPQPRVGDRGGFLDPKVCFPVRWLDRPHRKLISLAAFAALTVICHNSHVCLCYCEGWNITILSENLFSGNIEEGKFAQSETFASRFISLRSDARLSPFFFLAPFVPSLLSYNLFAGGSKYCSNRRRRKERRLEKCQRQRAPISLQTFFPLSVSMLIRR